MENISQIKELLFKIADDLLIIGHRNSEWTGLGPILEEDIAFSSIAQDQLGQARAIYNILHELGEPDSDVLAFMRDAKEFRSCQLVEYPIGEYEFSLIRNFLFSNALQLRFEMLSSSMFEPVSKLAHKIKGEIKYHIMHDDTWITQLGNASDESISRLQSALNQTFNSALGIFEPGDFEAELSEMKVFEGENILKDKWLEAISRVIEKTKLKLPEKTQWTPAFGGRRGYHTEYLQPLLDEMSEVYKIDPATEW
jgi:ring-1,2-phenylacetyl-CoA epoxidase subunit PaaC